MTAPTTGTYTFRTVTDDGARLWVNGQLLFDNWSTIATWPATQTSATMTLTAGQTYPVVLEYRDEYVNSQASLQWQTPGRAATW